MDIYNIYRYSSRCIFSPESVFAFLLGSNSVSSFSSIKKYSARRIKSSIEGGESVQIPERICRECRRKTSLPTQPRLASTPILHIVHVSRLHHETPDIPCISVANPNTSKNCVRAFLVLPSNVHFPWMLMREDDSRSVFERFAFTMLRGRVHSLTTQSILAR